MLPIQPTQGVVRVLNMSMLALKRMKGLVALTYNIGIKGFTNVANEVATNPANYGVDFNIT